nr:unnamed protein product [Callosobruchus chinensis]
MLQETVFNPITRRLKSIESTLHQNSRKKGKRETESDDDDDDNKNGGTKSLLQSTLSTQLKNEPMETIPVEAADEVKPPQQQPVSLRTLRPRRLSFDTPPVNIKQNIIDSISSGDYPATIDSDDDYGGVQVGRERNLDEESLIEYLDQYDPLPRKYIREMYEDGETKETDQQYGVRLDTTVEKFKIGDSQLDIVGSDVYVKGKRYKGTQGLYELLFKKYPNKALFNEEDVDNYRRIVYKTNAHRRHYRATGQIAGSRLEKYKKIIAPIASNVSNNNSGGSMMTMMEVTNNKKDYIYWDDPNELVDRLRLLVASQDAGHTGHVNEINSLIEELREAKIIE